MISRRIAARGGRYPVRSRHSDRNGHMRMDAIASTMVVNTTRNDERTANPAPGPIYAWAGRGVASTTPRANRMMTEMRMPMRGRERAVYRIDRWFLRYDRPPGNEVMKGMKSRQHWRRALGIVATSAAAYVVVAAAL